VSTSATSRVTSVSFSSEVIEFESNRCNDCLNFSSLVEQLFCSDSQSRTQSTSSPAAPEAASSRIAPFVGAIIAPFDPASHSVQSQVRWFSVQQQSRPANASTLPPSESSAPTNSSPLLFVRCPMEVPARLLHDAQVPTALIEAMEHLVKACLLHPQHTNFHEKWLVHQGADLLVGEHPAELCSTKLEKFKQSLHLLLSNSMTSEEKDTLVTRLVADVLTK